MFKRDPLTGLWRRAPRGLCSIMPGLGMMPPGFKVKASASDVVDLGTLEDTGTLATGTFAFSDYGAVNTNKLLISAAMFRDNATVFGFSGTDATFAGTPYNGNRQSRNEGLYFACIHTHYVTGSLSGSHVITMDEAIAQDKLCSMAAMPNGALLTDRGMEIGSASSGTSNTVSTNTAGGGGLNAGSFIFACVAKGAPTEGITFSDNSGDAGTWVELADRSNTDATARFGFAYKKLLTTVSASINVTATGGATSTAHAMVLFMVGA